MLWHHEKWGLAMSLPRAAASAAIIALLSSVCATAKPIATTAETNLRKGAGTDTEVLTLIPKGTTVEVGKCTKGWCEATLNEQSGYVIARNVGMAPHRAPAQVYEDRIVSGPPFGPRVYYRPYPYYGYPYFWGYRGWGWGWRWW
jgi:uncharacterized protein YraI